MSADSGARDEINCCSTVEADAAFFLPKLQMTRVEEDLNIAAVAAGVRPAWLCERTKDRARVKAAASGFGLHVSCDLTMADEGNRSRSVGFLVSRRAVSRPSSRVSHSWLGRRLGLPCASNVPWGVEREAFAVLGVKRAGTRARVDQHNLAGWAVRCDATLTTFWCADAGSAHSWWASLRSGAAAQRFQTETLAPLGLQLCFFCAVESPKLG